MDPRKIKSGGMQVVEFKQQKLIEGTPHAGGMCSSLSHIFLGRMFGQASLADFKGHKASLYTEAVKKSQELVDVERDGEDADSSFFNKSGMAAKLAVVHPDKLAASLEKADAALVTYETKSKVPHQIAFSREHGKCHFFEPNRGIMSGECKLVTASMRAIIGRSDPMVVKVTSGIKKP